MAKRAAAQTANLSYIAEGLRPLAVPLGSIELDPENARAHDRRSIETVKASLARFGQRQPVVVNRATRRLEAGEARHVAAGELGWTHLAALFVDDDEQRALAYSLVDNRSAEVGTEWKWETLAGALRGLRDAGDDMLSLGWTPAEMGPLMEATFNAARVAAELGENGDGPVRHVPPIVVTANQRTVIDAAVERLRAREGDGGLHEGRAIELICADFMGGPDPDGVMPDGEAGGE